MTILSTERLHLTELHTEDAAFIFRLVNSPGWLANIGDRNVRNLTDAVRYMQNGPMQGYADHGFGLWAMRLRSDNTPIGLCGLIRRPGLEDVDLGYALLPDYERQGYAFESASATLAFARQTLGIARIVAITLPSNQGSIRLLEKLGMQLEKTIRLPNEDVDLLQFGV
ncbi:MAG: GNAT family N-acetyltransferase [Lewinellaceae bacterium]|nr:GNAT family N-acetyltransferase [Lewinellaceae bacterium]